MVRRGLDKWVAGRTVADVAVLHPRAVRRHLAGPENLRELLTGRRVLAANRRGKYLWLPLDSGDVQGRGWVPSQVLVAHLGMSGQLLIRPADTPDEIHLRVRIRFTDGGRELRFVDQRTFGGLAIEPDAGGGLPTSLVHIARDPLDPEFDDAVFVAAVRRRKTGIKRALLDQTLVSGIGNIYADESLWRAKLHYARPTETLNRTELARLLSAIRGVLTEALSQGGTSFDSLYVNVNGESGFFDRSLDVYGQEGRACHRCGTPIRRDPFMNRSSYTCPHCQPRPRRARW